jgi:hypothetical protein
VIVLAFEKKHSEASRAKMRESHLGVKHSDEHKSKVSVGQKEYWKSLTPEEVTSKMSHLQDTIFKDGGFAGRVHSESSKQKQSENHHGGVSRPSLEDILEGKCPKLKTMSVKVYLIDAGVLEDKCEYCGWSKKRQPEDKYSTCELHHKNGDSTDHKRENLEILCRNCHSITPTYAGAKRGFKKQREIA